MKKILALILCFVMLFALTACVNFGDPQPAITQPTEPPATEPPVGYKPGNRCPSYDLPVITGEGDTGNTIDPTKTGKVTVINFWGTWCGPCVSELPHLEELAQNYADSVTVIAVHSTQDWKQAPRFLAKNYPDSSIVFSWESGNDYNGAYYLMMGGEGYYPYTVVLDANGIITETKVGGMTYEEMQEMVENAGAKESERPVAETPTTPSVFQAEIEDAYSYLRETDYGRRCYHIPKLILPDNLADSVNKTMYDHLYPMVEEAENPPDPYADYILEMQYSMWQSGEVISVVVSVMQPYNDYIEFFIYNVSAITGNLLSDEEVYSHFSVTSKEARENLVKYLDSYWDANREQIDEYMALFVQETYSEEYLDKAQIFAGPNGAMCFTTKIGTPAGAGYFNALINPDGELFYISCNIPGHDGY